MYILSLWIDYTVLRYKNYSICLAFIASPFRKKIIVRNRSVWHTFSFFRVISLLVKKLTLIKDENLQYLKTQKPTSSSLRQAETRLIPVSLMPSTGVPDDCYTEFNFRLRNVRY